MSTVFFASYLVGLRDGLEAALVVTILLTVVARSGRRGALVPLWSGVGLAVAAAAVAALAFVAVIREGVEMVLLVFAAAQTVAPLLGMIAGVATAVLLGWLMYQAVARVNLGRLFTWTGALLILVAAGIAKYAVHGFQVAGALPGAGDVAYDLSTTVEPTSWYGTLLAATVNLTPSATALEIGVWLAYAAGVLILFFRPAKADPGSRAAKVGAPPAAATSDRSV